MKSAVLAYTKVPDGQYFTANSKEAGILKIYA